MGHGMLNGEVRRPMARKKADVQPAEEIHIVVRLTLQGVTEAEAALAAIKRKVRDEARQDLLELMHQVQARNPGLSEDQLLADIEEARAAYHQEKPSPGTR